MAWIPEIGALVRHKPSELVFTVIRRSRNPKNNSTMLFDSDDRWYWLKECVPCSTSRHTEQDGIQVGDLVTGVEGRDSHGWHGTVEKVERNPLYYRVYWRERKEMGILGGAVLGMLPDQICNKKH